jgi:3-hydroxyacyl-[acyl-carrier-protein] dehydratase
LSRNFWRAGESGEAQFDGMEMNQEAIKALIPHREPFLFIDSVVEVDDEHLVAKRTVSGDEPQFEGHYPGNPIMPGVLLCETIFQAAAVYIAKRFDMAAVGDDAATPVLARIQDARFKQMVKPGDEIEITVTYKEALGQFHFMKGAIRKAGKVVTTVEFALAMVRES